MMFEIVFFYPVDLVYDMHALIASMQMKTKREKVAGVVIIAVMVNMVDTRWCESGYLAPRFFLLVFDNFRVAFKLAFYP